MRLVDILEKAIQKQIAYNDAIQELKNLKLPYDDQEKYEVLLYKLLGNDKRVFHDPSYCFTGVLNENFLKILQETIQFVRDGLYSGEIAQELFEKYALSSLLISYFINEAISIVRMNNLSPEEMSQIGEAYHQVALNLQQRGMKEKPEIQVDAPEIRAEEVSSVDLQEVEE